MEINWNIVTPILGCIITSLVTLYGFKKQKDNLKDSFSNEILKLNESNKLDLYRQKQSLATEAIKDTFFDICNWFDLLRSKNSSDLKKFEKQFIPTMNTIYAYGSNDAIKILTKMQRLSYSGDSKGVITISLLSLLISQLKYDITGEILPPDSFCKMRITDYETSTKNNLEKCINAFITELELNSNFIIKQRKEG